MLSHAGDDDGDVGNVVGLAAADAMLRLGRIKLRL